MNSAYKASDKYDQMMRHMLFLTSYSNPNSGAEMSQESLDKYREDLYSFFMSSDNEHYLKNYAAYDIISRTSIHGLYVGHKRLTKDSFGKVSSAKEHPCKLVALAAESLFDSMMQSIGNCQIAFFSIFTEKGFGETAMKLEEKPQDVYADLLRHAAEYDGHLFSHIIMHTLLRVGVDNILKYDEYGAQEVYMLGEYVPENILLRKGGNRLRRHLAENSLAL